MNDHWGLTPILPSLKPLQRIALTLWCMDRAFIILDAISIHGDEALQLDKVRRKGEALWSGPGAVWSIRELEALRRDCEDYDADGLGQVERNNQKLSRIFVQADWISDDNIRNAVTDAVSIVWFLTSVISRPSVEIVIEALEPYYDIFFQPTWARLTGGRSAILNEEVAGLSKSLEATDPLKTADEQFKLHVMRLKEMHLDSLQVSALRGNI